MQLLLARRSFHYLIALMLAGAAIVLLVRVVTHEETERITTTITRGDVIELVSISGFVEAQNAAELSFPQAGIVANVNVREGDVIREGDTIIALERAALLAERQDALAALASAQADRDELVSGPRAEARSVTATEVSNAQGNLQQVERAELEKIKNARRTLLSSDLEALSQSGNENAATPTISGTYQCENEGAYEIEVFRSGASSGYSLRISGLETGTYTAYIEQSGPLGECGLRIQLGAGGGYTNSTWTVAVPNQNSSTYVSNLNAYELAVEQAENAISAAERALALAEQQANLENAAPRSESLTRADASVTSVRARLAAIDAQLADRVLTAPFDGVVTKLDVLPGETVTSAPVVTVLADDTFDLTARIPEIDITKVNVGQSASVIFDARSEEPVFAEVHFISPIATEIDGVAYFEATLTFPEPPTWLRSGLNADVDITVAAALDTPRIPARFLIREANETFVLTAPTADASAPLNRTPVEVRFAGNDGFVAVAGLPEGATVVAP